MFNINRTKIPVFFRIPYESNYSLVEEKVLPNIHRFLQVLRMVNVMIHWNVLHPTVQMLVISFKVLILIIHQVQLYVMTPLEPALISPLCIESLPWFWISVMISRIKFYLFMSKYVSVHHPILSGLVRNFLPQCSSQSWWRYIFSTMNECNTVKKNSRTKMELTSSCGVYNTKIYKNHIWSFRLHQGLFWQDCVLS